MVLAVDGARQGKVARPGWGFLNDGTWVGLAAEFWIPGVIFVFSLTVTDRQAGMTSRARKGGRLWSCAGAALLRIQYTTHRGQNRRWTTSLPLLHKDKSCSCS